MSHGVVFRFCRGPRDCGLFLSLPRHCRLSKKNEPTSEKFAREWAAGPVRHTDEDHCLVAKGFLGQGGLLSNALCVKLFASAPPLVDA